MTATYSIKRNSLSSKWGVWTTDSESGSPIEKLVAELKTQEDAEAYSARIQAGESHDVIMASLSGSKSKQEGAGLFGRLFKRGSAAHVEAPANNSVIEIETSRPEPPSPEVAQAASALDSVNGTAKQARESVSEEPSRFQPIEQVKVPQASTPAPQQVPVEAPEVVSPVAEEVDTATEEVPERPSEQNQRGLSPVSEVRAQPETVQAPPAEQEKPAAEDVQLTADSIPAAPVETRSEAPSTPSVDNRPATESQQEPVSQPQSPPPAQSKADSRDDGLLVDWTFTPPPDVTPAELEASGQQVPEATRQASANGASAQAQNTESDSGRMTVEVCVSKAMKEMSSGDPRVSDKKYNSIASKEYTEVNKAFTTGSSPEYLREELTHLAAVCLAWAEAIEKRQNRGAEAA